MSNVDANLVNRAAEVLAQARKTKSFIPNIPVDCRPTDIDTAIAVQNRTMELLGEKTGGWKCGLQAKPEMVMLAPVPSSAIYRSSPVAVTVGKIEPEIAFVLGKDLPARATPYTEQDIRAAIGDIRFVLELIGARYSNVVDVTYHELLADCYNNYGLFIGPSVPGALDKPLESLHVKITTPSATIVDRDGNHPSGHPMNSFSWLVNYLSARGQGLKAGEIITTGSYAGVVDVPIGEPLRVELGGFAAIEVKLIPA
jgi:2-keto-4-pentenoate hydratase